MTVGTVVTQDKKLIFLEDKGTVLCGIASLASVMNVPENSYVGEC